MSSNSLTQYDRDNKRRAAVSINDASVIKRFYSVRMRDGTWNDSIEDYFMNLENATGFVLDKMVQGEVPSREEKCKFALFLARQIQRGSFVANFARIEARKFLNHDFVLKVIDANRAEFDARYGGTAVENALRDFVATGTGVNIDDKQYLLALLSETPKLAAVIADSRWRVERSDDGYFSTSDQPVAIRKRSSPRASGFVGLLEPEAELYFPLTKNCMLITSANGDEKWDVQIGRSRARELNRITVINAFRFVFTPEPDSEIETLIAEHENDRVRFKEMKWHD